MCGMSQLFTTAYHPQTNGLTERLNKTLGDMLSIRIGTLISPFVTFAYNTAKQETTVFTPFYLVHGREAETMLDTLLPYQPDYENDEYLSQLIIDAEDARQLARLHTLRTQDIEKRRYDSRHRPVYYNVGDLVWISHPCVKSISDVTYEVMTVDESSRRKRSKDVAHVLRMKPYKDPGQQDNQQVNGIPIGSPLSPFLAYLVLNCLDTLYWGRNVDDVMAIVATDYIENTLAFFKYLYPLLKFTTEKESNGFLTFLDIIFEIKLNYLQTTVYRKPSHLPVYLHANSFSPISHKISLISHSWDKQSSCNLVVPIPSILNQNFKIQLIEVTSHNIPNDAIVVAECQKGLLLERELMSSSSVISLFNNR
ncbi:hypothetical protein LAZ67_11001994, partial [Cordylochernes scorpioides]